MKKSDIYEIAVKILGLYVIVLAIGTIRDLFTSISFLLDNKNEHMDLSSYIWVSIFNLFLMTSVAYFLLYKYKGIVKGFCKVSDYEEDVKLFASKSVIYEIALVLTGFLLIVWTLPDFAYKLVNYVKLVQSNTPTNRYDDGFLITSALKILLGVFVILLSKSLADFLTKEKE